MRVKIVDNSVFFFFFKKNINLKLKKQNANLQKKTTQKLFWGSLSTLYFLSFDFLSKVIMYTFIIII